MKKTEKIILTHLPPASVMYPSPALSILKSFMNTNGFDTEIQYWNFALNGIISGDRETELEDIEMDLMPFYGIMADRYQDNEASEKIQAFLHEVKPFLLMENPDRHKTYLEEIKKTVLERINMELDRIDFSEVLLFGVSYRLHQLIPAAIVAREIKKRSPLTKIVIGGLGTRQSAEEVMQIVPDFDFAIWGEGEYPLLDLARTLEKGTDDFSEVARLIHRKNSELVISTNNKSQYLDFDSYILPDYDDYFPLMDQIQKKDEIFYPINSVRSCYWKKCRFCNYNTGYKYRERTPESVVHEIKHFYENHGIRKFYFVDNDLVGTSIDRFDRLLDAIADFRKTHHAEFSMWGEMIPNRDMNAQMISKLTDAGFDSVFIGYEGISDSLLKKMRKNNDFALNLFMVKNALKNDVQIMANLIRDIPDETRQDVLESIRNLHFLRFFYHHYTKNFQHNLGTFTLYKEASYYSSVDTEDIRDHHVSCNYHYIPREFISRNTTLFGFQRSSLRHRFEWNHFSHAEDFYRENKFTYTIEKSDGMFLYREFLNNEQYNEILFDQPEYVDVLKICSAKVCGLEELHQQIVDKYPQVHQDKLKEIIQELSAEYLLYHNREMTSICSLVTLE